MPTCRHPRFVTSGAAALALLLLTSCGGGGEFNLFESVSKGTTLKHDTSAQLEQARVDLDKGDDASALSLLQPIIADPTTDSDEARVLAAAATLGSAGVDVWETISELLSTLDQVSDQRSQGLNQVLDSLSDTVFGTGTTRTAKIAAMQSALTILEAAPGSATTVAASNGTADPLISNTACVVAAFLAVPTLADAAAAITDLETALTGAASGSCSRVTSITSDINEMATVATNLNGVLAAASSCTFLNIDQAGSQTNSIEQALSTVSKTGGKGCGSVPSSVSGASCLQQVLSATSSLSSATGGKLSACSLIVNCTTPSSCFQLN